MNAAILLLLFTAALLAWLAWRVGRSILHDARRNLLPPAEADRRAAFLGQLAAMERERLASVVEKAGPEPALVPDESEQPPERKRGRPRKLAVATLSSADQEKSRPPPKQPKVQTLVSGLKLEVQFEYAGGHLKGPREAVIISALGQIEPDGGYNVTTLRCICLHQQAWRAFRLDRISNLADLSTGEVVPDPKAWITHRLNVIA
jgi:hypothetical protein